MIATETKISRGCVPAGETAYMEMDRIVDVVL
jgi:hypothetical protein